MQITIPLIPLIIIILLIVAIKTSSNENYIKSFGPDVKYPTIKSVSDLENGKVFIFDSSNITLNVGDYFVNDKRVYQVTNVIRMSEILTENEGAVNAKYCMEPQNKTE